MCRGPGTRRALSALRRVSQQLVDSRELTLVATLQRDGAGKLVVNARAAGVRPRRVWVWARERAAIGKRSATGARVWQ